MPPFPHDAEVTGTKVRGNPLEELAPFIKAAVKFENDTFQAAVANIGRTVAGEATFGNSCAISGCSASAAKGPLADLFAQATKARVR